MKRNDACITDVVVVRCLVNIGLFPRVIPTRFLFRHAWASLKLSKFSLTLNFPVGVCSQLTLLVDRVNFKKRRH